MAKRPYIRFSLDEGQKQYIEMYAKIKGFDTGSNLARMALFAYIRRNTLSDNEKANCNREKRTGDELKGDYDENTEYNTL